MSDLRVERVKDAELPALRAFLERRPDAHISYSPDWHAVIRDAYGHACDYWVAWSGDQIVGVFPVLVVRVPVLGTKMIALGYQMDSVLPLAASAEAGEALVKRAIAETVAAGAKYLEVRSLTPSPLLEDLGFTRIDSGLVSTIVPLEDLSLRRLREGHRKSIRNAERMGIAVTESRSANDLRRFQRMCLVESRSLGAPQAGRRFFRGLHRHLHANYRLYIATLDGQLLGSMVTIGDACVVYARYWGFSDHPDAPHCRSALLWRAMNDAAAAGVRSFNLGISWQGADSIIRWKEGWRGETVPVWLYSLPVRSAPPRPGDYLGGFGLAKAVWKKLPLPLAEVGGSLVTRWIC